jgi:hypothetical protein
LDNHEHLARLLLNPHASQRSVDQTLREPDALFTNPARRRLTAEEIVYSWNQRTELQ